MKQHNVVIIGGGTGGIAVAARLRRKGVSDIAIIEPSETHWYQPLWTLVGGGLEPAKKTSRPMSTLIPKGTTWIKSSATEIDPSACAVTLADGSRIGYS